MVGKGNKPEKGRDMKKHFKAPYWLKLEERKIKEIKNVRGEVVKEAAVLLKNAWEEDITSPSIPDIRETMKRRGTPLTALEEKLMIRLATVGG